MKRERGRDELERGRKSRERDSEKESVCGKERERVSQAQPQAQPV